MTGKLNRVKLKRKNESQSDLGSKKNETRDSSIKYATAGFAVLPVWARNGDTCACGKLTCGHPGKHPIAEFAPNGYKSATKSIESINRYFKRYPNAGIAIATGAVSGVVVIDVDVKNGVDGNESLRRLEEELGELPATRTATTPSGGRHLYFRYAPGIKCTQSAIGAGIDVKSDGGMIILPPSHGLYRWEDEEAEISELPAKWIERLSAQKASGPYKPTDFEKRIDDLVALDPFEYERIRKSVANELGLRIAILDEEIEARRKELSDDDPFLAPVTPWPEPVDGDDLLSEFVAEINRHLVLKDEHQALAVALWVLNAHAHDAATHSPILVVTSPTKRCGKTRTLEVITHTVPKPLPASNVTPAVVYRAIEKYRPTIVIDEADTFLRQSPELRGVINSGHTRNTAYVLRSSGDDHEPTRFGTWTPKAIASIGTLNPTIMDRAVVITMRRKTVKEKVKPIPPTPKRLEKLKRKAARWALENIDELKKSRKNLLPASLNDRAKDNWRPLLRIAALCSEEWLKRAKATALSISEIEDDETFAIQLLTDIRNIFNRTNHDRVSSELLVEELRNIESRPWSEFKHGRPITARGVAALLKDFGVAPKQIRLNSCKARKNGYYANQFADAFKRYLPPMPSKPSDGSDTDKNSNKNKG